MDYQSNQQANNDFWHQSPSGKHSLPMEAASLILGTVSIVTCTCVYTSLVCGALAIIFAILSRGGEYTMSTRAKTGMWLGIIGIIIFILLLLLTAVTIASYGGIDAFMQEVYNMYGIDYQSLYN